MISINLLNDQLQESLGTRFVTNFLKKPIDEYKTLFLIKCINKNLNCTAICVWNEAKCILDGPFELKKNDSETDFYTIEDYKWVEKTDELYIRLIDKNDLCVSGLLNGEKVKVEEC